MNKKLFLLSLSLMLLLSSCADGIPMEAFLYYGNKHQAMTSKQIRDLRLVAGEAIAESVPVDDDATLFLAPKQNVLSILFTAPAGVIEPFDGPITEVRVFPDGDIFTFAGGRWYENRGNPRRGVWLSLLKDMIKE